MPDRVRIAGRTASRSLMALAAVSVLTAAKPAAPGVEGAWSRPVSQGATAVGFMTVVNASSAADALVGVTSPLSPMVMIHETTMANGVASMRMLDRVEVGAHGAVVFGPGGRHLMFTGMTRPLKIGDRLPATLRFASGRSVDVNFAVGLSAPKPRK